MFYRVTALAVALAAAASAYAFEEIPRASASALGVTRGKQFSSGLVFVNGKYMPPPYVVERWGTGIRINSKPVTGQVIDWSEFVKTQDPANVTKTTPEPVAQPEPQPVETEVEVETETDSDTDALDDLFDDVPKPKKAKKKVVVRRAPPRPKAPVPRYELNGSFVRNDASNALVKRINDQRTEIDGILRRGGFVFFGDGYTRVSGDSRTADSMLAVLPELMQNSEGLDAFRSALRSRGMVYIGEIISEQLFGNRIDYRRLMERRHKIKEDREWEKMLKDAGGPVL